MFLIWVGEYSGKDVIATSEDKKIAEAYAKLHNGYVTEAPLINDSNIIQKANDLIHEWKFRFIIDNVSIRLSSMNNRYIESEEKKEDDYTKLAVTIYIYVDDEDSAKKIAWDRAYKIQAERLGL